MSLRAARQPSRSHLWAKPEARVSEIQGSDPSLSLRILRDADLAGLFDSARVQADSGSGQAADRQTKRGRAGPGPQPTGGRGLWQGQQPATVVLDNTRSLPLSARLAVSGPGPGLAVSGP